MPPQEALALTNASVVNVRTGAVARNATVLMRGGTHRIRRSAGAGGPAGVRVVDLRGRYVVPGLIDAHVHIGSLAQMRAALDSGVTTVRSAGVSHFVDVGLRELVKNGSVAGPDIIAAGYHVRPGVAPELFMDFPELGELMGGVNTADALRRAVQANLSRGVDWIKTLATERAGTPDTDPRKQVYSQEELRILVVEAGDQEHSGDGACAWRRGCRRRGPRRRAQHRARHLSHRRHPADDGEAGHLLRSHRRHRQRPAEPGGDYDHAALKRRGEMMRPILMAAIGQAMKLGVKIVAGSDTGYGPNSVARVSREVGMLVEAGMTPLQALQAATITNAEMLRLEKQLGEIEAGFEADVLVVDANPLENVRTLLDPLLVISNGRLALDRLTFAK